MTVCSLIIIDDTDSKGEKKTKDKGNGYRCYAHVAPAQSARCDLTRAPARRSSVKTIASIRRNALIGTGQWKDMAVKLECKMYEVRGTRSRVSVRAR